MISSAIQHRSPFADSPREVPRNRGTTVTGIGRIALSSLAAVGWAMGLPALWSAMPHRIAMTVNSALGFPLLGLALWCLRPATVPRIPHRAGDGCAPGRHDRVSSRQNGVGCSAHNPEFAAALARLGGYWPATGKPPQE